MKNIGTFSRSDNRACVVSGHPYMIVCSYMILAISVGARIPRGVSNDRKDRRDGSGRKARITPCSIGCKFRTTN